MSVVDSLAAVDAAAKAHPQLRIEESGDASISKATLEKSNEEMGKSALLTLPLTLLILVFTFGALVAAGIPVLLALTSVVATLGLLGPVSQIAPVDASVMHVVLLVGMAVGVDYSLFYLKREREERAAGREKDAAIEAAAATSGRAVVISGLTVMVAMAGMYLGGISNFASFATGTIMVVAVAVARIPDRPARRCSRSSATGSRRAASRSSGASRAGWARPASGRASSTGCCGARCVSALVSAGVLVALAVPALGMETSLGGTDDYSRDLQVMQTYDRIQAAFPSEGSAEMVVVKADDVTAPQVVSAINSLETKAAERPGLFEGEATVELSYDQTVAIVTLPTTGTGTGDQANQAADALRNDLVPSTLGELDGVEAYTTGEAAATGDFNDAMIGNLPYVFAFVLSAAFLLLLVTFRSLVIPIKAIVLNLLSVGSAYGLLVLAFRPGECSLRRHRRLAAAVPVRDPVRALDGLPRVHPDPHPRGVRSRHDDRGRSRTRDQEHGRRGHERSDRHGRGVLDVRALVGAADAADGHRPRGRRPDRRHDHPRRAAAVGDEAARRPQLVAARAARLAPQGPARSGGVPARAKPPTTTKHHPGARPFGGRRPCFRVRSGCRPEWPYRSRRKIAV